MAKNSDPRVTKARAIQESIKPLIEWMRQFKPERRELHIFRREYQWLTENVDAARTHGFSLNPDGKLTYGEFHLLPHE